jgi:hypothetical protein
VEVAQARQQDTAPQGPRHPSLHMGTASHVPWRRASPTRVSRRIDALTARASARGGNSPSGFTGIPQGERKRGARWIRLSPRALTAGKLVTNLASARSADTPQIWTRFSPAPRVRATRFPRLAAVRHRGSHGFIGFRIEESFRPNHSAHQNPHGPGSLIRSHGHASDDRECETSRGDTEASIAMETTQIPTQAPPQTPTQTMELTELKGKTMSELLHCRRS